MRPLARLVNHGCCGSSAGHADLLTLAHVGGVALLVLVIVLSDRLMRRAGRPPRERMLLAIAIPVCAVVILGLLLAIFSADRTAYWLAGVAALDLGLLMRLAGTGPAGRSSRPEPRRRVRLRRRQVGPALLAVAGVGLSVAAVSLSSASARHQAQRSHFTQLWLLPLGDGSTAQLGVGNRTGRREAVVLEVEAAGHALQSQNLDLAAGQNWTTELSLPAALPRELVRARLFVAGQTAPERVVGLWTP